MYVMFVYECLCVSVCECVCLYGVCVCTYILDNYGLLITSSGTVFIHLILVIKFYVYLILIGINISDPY